VDVHGAPWPTTFPEPFPQGRMVFSGVRQQPESTQIGRQYGLRGDRAPRAGRDRRAHRQLLCICDCR
jgi:hypothetical protein